MPALVVDEHQPSDVNLLRSIPRPFERDPQGKEVWVSSGMKLKTKINKRDPEPEWCRDDWHECRWLEVGACCCYVKGERCPSIVVRGFGWT